MFFQTMEDIRKVHRFTLIELLICIAVIMILVAMLMPALTGVRKRAKRVACMNNLKQIGMTQYNYASENERKMILGSMVSRQNNVWIYTTQHKFGNYYPLYLAGYMQDPHTWYCPSVPGNSVWAFNHPTRNPWPPGVGAVWHTKSTYSSRSIFRGSAGGTIDMTGFEYHVDLPSKFVYPAVRMNKLADQAIMADVISHPGYLKNFHETGFNVLRLDNSVHWKSVGLLPDSWLAISGPWGMSANNAIDASWEAMD